MGNKDIKVKVIVLEAPLATPLSAILHIVRGQNRALASATSMFMQAIHQPISYLSVWAKNLYYAAQICDIDGEKPLESIQKIPIAIPIVIAHAKGDMTTDFNGSKALYYARAKLLPKNQNNTYFIRFDGEAHGGLFLNSYLPNIIIKQVTIATPVEAEENLVKNSRSILEAYNKLANHSYSPLRPIKYYESVAQELYKEDCEKFKSFENFKLFLSEIQEIREINKYTTGGAQPSFKLDNKKHQVFIFYSDKTDPKQDNKRMDIELNRLAVDSIEKDKPSYLLDFLPPTCSDNKKAKNLEDVCKKYDLQPEAQTFKKEFEVISSRERVIDVTDNWAVSLLKRVPLYRMSQWFTQGSKAPQTTKEQSNSRQAKQNNL